MARYGTFPYGEKTYGTDTVTYNLWTFQVDWLGDGTFNPPSTTFNNEAMRMVDLTVRRGRDAMLGGGADFLPMRPGEMVAILDNSDRRYDPNNAAGPLYGYIEPGKLVRLLVKAGTAGTNYDVLHGVITDIQPILIDGVLHARIVVGDGLRWLLDHQFLVDLKAAAAKTTIVNSILTDVGFPWAHSADDSTEMAGTYYRWWEWKTPALTALREIAKTEVGVLFHARDGTLYLYSRDFTHNRSQAVDEDVILRDVVVPYPWANVRNEIQVMTYLVTIGNQDIPGVTNNKVWEFPGASSLFWIPIADGETITFDVEFVWSSALLGKFAVINERLIYLVYDNGSEIQADCPATWETPVSTGTRVSITNNAGVDGTLKSAAFYGDIAEFFATTAREAQDATSQAAYGKQELTITGFWRLDQPEAQDIADWLLAELKDPLQSGLVIQFEDRPTYQFNLDLYDRVVLTLGTYDISANFRVGEIKHEWLSENGINVRTTMKLEPYLTPF